MNLIEHRIVEIHSVEDVTEQFERKVGIKPREPFFQVDLTHDCYGQVTREKKYFYQTEWEVAKLKGYFMS